MAYTYISSIPNRLSTIAETSLITKGFKKISAGATAYTYDLNGNMTDRSRLSGKIDPNRKGSI